MSLTQTFWRQSWKKKIVDVCVALLLCGVFRGIGMIVFNMSIGLNVEKLNMMQTCIFISLSGVITMFLFFNFAELFVFLSLGGVALLNQTCYESICNRIEEYRKFEELKQGKKVVA